MTESNRLIFIDYLRASVFLLLAFDHSLHAYAFNWGKFHFIEDIDRSLLFDVFYMFDNSIIMPMLFFIVGLFVIPSLNHHGVLSYFSRRLVKLGVPFVIGVPFITPLLSFPRYLEKTNSDISYLDYWLHVYLPQDISAGGPFWVLYAIFLYSLIVAIFYKVFPRVILSLGSFVRFLVASPIKGMVIFLTLSALILGVTDLIWGAPWWFRLWWIFSFQGSRFLLHALYFLMGVAFSMSGLLTETAFWKKLADRWTVWLGFMLVSGIFYIGYSLSYFHDGAYNNDVRAYFYHGGSLMDSWPVFINHAPMVLLRTTLYGIFCFFQALTFLSAFYRFFNRFNPTFYSLARNAYGIFLLHEIPVIWLQYGLIGFEFPVIFKVAVVFILGFFGTWFINDKVLLKIPLVRRVLA
jgi:hypothetical protein